MMRPSKNGRGPPMTVARVAAETEAIVKEASMMRTALDRQLAQVEAENPQVSGASRFCVAACVTVRRARRARALHPASES